jgi:hypothetical protein
MRVSPVTRVKPLNNGMQPARINRRETVANRKQSAPSEPVSSGYETLYLYGYPGKFGMFPCYGNFSVKV